MSNPFNPAALEPYQPFYPPVPIPGSGACDDPLVCVSFSSAWLPYVLGCLKALLMDSTWASRDATALSVNRRNVNDLILNFMVENCLPSVEFRFDPEDVTKAQYSLDGGVTWLDFPDIAATLARTSDLAHFLVDNPGVLRENGIEAQPGHYALNADGFGATPVVGIAQHGANVALDVYSIAENKPVLRLGRHLADGAYLSVSLDAVAETVIINPDQTIVNPTVGTLPTADYAHVGTLVALEDAITHITTLYTCRITSTTPTFAWEPVGGGSAYSFFGTYTPLDLGSTPYLTPSLVGANVTYDMGLPPYQKPLTFPSELVPVDAGTPPYITKQTVADGSERLILNAAFQLDGLPIVPSTSTPAAGQTQHYRLYIDAQGTDLPFALTAGQKLKNRTVDGLWSYFETDPNAPRIVTASGLTGTTNPGWGLQGSLIGQAFNADTYIFEAPPFNWLSGVDYTPTDPVYIHLSMLDSANNLLGIRGRGQVAVGFDVESPAPSGWTISIPLGTLPGYAGWSTSYAGEGGVPTYTGVEFGSNCVYTLTGTLALVGSADTMLTHAELTTRGYQTVGTINRVNVFVDGATVSTIDVPSDNTEQIAALTGLTTSLTGSHSVALRAFLLGNSPSCHNATDDFYGVYQKLWVITGTGTPPTYS